MNKNFIKRSFFFRLNKKEKKQSESILTILSQQTQKYLPEPLGDREVASTPIIN